jgi:hypothetical protein
MMFRFDPHMRRVHFFSLIYDQIFFSFSIIIFFLGYTTLVPVQARFKFCAHDLMITSRPELQNVQL